AACGRGPVHPAGPGAGAAERRRPLLRLQCGDDAARRAQGYVHARDRGGRGRGRTAQEGGGRITPKGERGASAPWSCKGLTPKGERGASAPWSCTQALAGPGG